MRLPHNAKNAKRTTAFGRLWRIASFTSPNWLERNHSRLSGVGDSRWPLMLLGFSCLCPCFEQAVRSSYQSKVAQRAFPRLSPPGYRSRPGLSAWPLRQHEANAPVAPGLFDGEVLHRWVDHFLNMWLTVWGECGVWVKSRTSIDPKSTKTPSLYYSQRGILQTLTHTRTSGSVQNDCVMVAITQPWTLELCLTKIPFGKLLRCPEMTFFV